ncbi:Uncharacterised protein [Dorea longicatena]|nr:Uncharacterised protein [Dorea longicatena]
MGVKGVDDMSVEEYRKAAVDAVSWQSLLMQMLVHRVIQKMQA